MAGVLVGIKQFLLMVEMVMVLLKRQLIMQI